MKHRIVSSRIPVKAHATHVYKFIENLENHQQIVPGASRWSGDRDTATYALRVGAGRKQVETRISERVVGMRICEESTGALCAYHRWFKLQIDERECILEIAMECEMSSLQRFFLGPVLKSQIEQMARNIKRIMETPKESTTAASDASLPA